MNLKRNNHWNTNNLFKKAASGDYKDIVVVEQAELVSQDFNGNPASSIIDLPSTMMIGPKLLKVLSWYDNETGFSNRMVDLALYMSKLGL